MLLICKYRCRLILIRIRKSIADIFTQELGDCHVGRCVDSRFVVVCSTREEDLCATSREGAAC